MQRSCLLPRPACVCLGQVLGQSCPHLLWRFCRCPGLLPALPCSSCPCRERQDHNEGVFIQSLKSGRCWPWTGNVPNVFFLGKKNSNLEGNGNLQTFHSGMEQHQWGRALAGLWARVCPTWLCPVRSLGLAHEKVFLADISCPNCFPFHRSISPVTLACETVDLTRGSQLSLSFSLCSRIPRAI